MFGLDDILGGIAGSAVGGLMSWFGQKSANEANERLANKQMDFQRQANKQAMDFGDVQARKAEKFSSAEAAINRQWTHEEAGRAMDFTGGQAQKAMDFSERMSNTQWQRGVEDMKAAGINPMLAAMKGGGASSPSGLGATGAVGSSSAPSGVAAHGQTSQGAMARQENTFRDVPQAISTALGLARTKAEIDLVHQQIQVAKAQEINVAADAAYKTASTKNVETYLPGRQKEAEIDKGTFGTIMRYISRASPAISTAAGLAGTFMKPRVFNFYPRK